MRLLPNIPFSHRAHAGRGGEGVDALRLAGSLLARQRLLPSLVREAGVYRARWEPVPLDTDHERLAALAARMPGVARALSGDPTPDPPATPPGTVLACFVAAVVDRLARDAEPFGLGLRPLGPRRREDSASLHDAWVRALRSPDDTLPGDPQELEVFAEAVDHWLRPVTLASRAPFRLSLRYFSATFPAVMPMWQSYKPSQSAS